MAHDTEPSVEMKTTRCDNQSDQVKPEGRLKLTGEVETWEVCSGVPWCLTMSFDDV